jgi:hypothetical protein
MKSERMSERRIFTTNPEEEENERAKWKQKRLKLRM